MHETMESMFGPCASGGRRPAGGGGLAGKWRRGAALPGVGM